MGCPAGQPTCWNDSTGAARRCEASLESIFRIVESVSRSRPAVPARYRDHGNVARPEGEESGDHSGPAPWRRRPGRPRPAAGPGRRRAREPLPGGPGARQPVHTVYVPADQLTPELPAAWGAQALAALEGHAARPRRRSPRPPALDPAAGRPGLARRARQAGARAGRGPAHRLRGRLRRPAGRRGGRRRRWPRPRRWPRRVAGRARRRRTSGSASSAWRRRPGAAGCGPSTCSSAACWPGRRLPDGFVVTLPKVTSTSRQVDGDGLVCGRLEEAHGLARRRLRFEIQVETPQAILRRRRHRHGRADDRMPPTAAARGLHYGTYDYSAGLGHRRRLPEHGPPGRRPRQGGHAGGRGRHRGRLSDGSTNVAPGRRHRRRCTRPGGCTPGWSGARWRAASTRAGTCTRPSCRPATWPTYAFYREGLPTGRGPAARLCCSATGGGVLDEPATAQALAGFVAAGPRLRRPDRLRGPGAHRPGPGRDRRLDQAVRRSLRLD